MHQDPRTARHHCGRTGRRAGAPSRRAAALVGDARHPQGPRGRRARHSAETGSRYGTHLPPVLPWRRQRASGTVLFCRPAEKAGEVWALAATDADEGRGTPVPGIEKDGAQTPELFAGPPAARTRPGRKGHRKGRAPRRRNRPAQGRTGQAARRRRKLTTARHLTKVMQGGDRPNNLVEKTFQNVPCLADPQSPTSPRHPNMQGTE